jgi:hypothetical protein
MLADARAERASHHREQAEANSSAGREAGQRPVQGTGQGAGQGTVQGVVRAHSVSLSMPWQAAGPAQVSTSAYGLVTGRVTSLAADPSDATGNTLYVGTTGGGVWKSINAAGSSSSVTFTPLTDATYSTANSSCSATNPLCVANDFSLSIGALTVQPGGTGVILAGTGDPNDATDSYYGAGILRSTDGGLSWSLITETVTGTGAPVFTFFGNSFAGFAWSGAAPGTVVAAVTSSVEGIEVNAGLVTSGIRGLYYSQDAGQTWQLATIMDGAQVVQSANTQFAGPGNAATSVVWDAARQMFYAAVRFHGYYQSPDGVSWTRLANQPGTNLTTANCPVQQGLSGSPGCPILRGVLAAQPVTGDLFALTVDDSDFDQGLWQDVCGLASGACSTPAVAFGTQIPDAALEAGSGDTTIPQADYDLTLAAVPSQQDTLLFAGTVDVYRASEAGGWAWSNTTNSLNYTGTQRVAPAQHAVDATIPAISAGSGCLMYFGNDGGLWRSTNLVGQPLSLCPASDGSNYDNLNGGLGSLAEVENLALDATNAQSMMVSLGALGTAAPQGSFTSWAQVLDGEGNYAAIDPAADQNWYATSLFGVDINRCTAGLNCDEALFDPGTPVIGNTQVEGDGYTQQIPAPWILDPQDTSQIILGTCRVWRGSATGVGWPGTNLLSTMLDGDQMPSCDGNAEVRSLAASGTPGNPPGTNPAGTTELIYAGMAGLFDGGEAIPGHVFSQSIANNSTAALPWADLTATPNVVNASSAGDVFNPGGFDVSSIYVDPHDPTGQTVYVTIQGFSGNGVNAAKVYATNDGGYSWVNVTGYLPNAPANSVVVDPNDARIVYLATDTGVWVTTDMPDCINLTIQFCEWDIYGTSLPNAPVVQLAAVTAGATPVLRAATYGRGVWQIPLATASVVYTTATATPDVLTFSSQPLQTQSAPQQVLVQNTGALDLTVGSLNVTGDFSESDNCTAAIAPGDACTINVSFLPTQTGQRAGVLTIYANVSGGQVTVALTGTAIPGASVVLTPGSLSFPQTLVGQTAIAQDVTISNTGGAAATLTSETATGDFKISANTCGSSVDADSGCTLSIAFTPSASGSRTGTLTVVDAVGTQTVTLAGIGLSPATDGLSPSSLSFAAVVIGQSSAAQNVTLTNTGDQALELISAQTTGDFSAVNGCGASLAGHASCSIPVVFTPTKTGAEQGTLVVSDVLQQQTVVLSGTGLAPAGISAEPATLSFGNYGVGDTSPAMLVALTNNGGLPLSGLQYAVSGDFSLAPASTNPCGASLATTAGCQIGIVFSPAIAGPRSGTLTVTGGGLPAPLNVALTGNGEDFTLQVSGSSTLTVTSGQTGTYSVQILPVNGSTGSVTLACTGYPQYSTCTLNPATVTLSGTGTSFTTVTVATGVATSPTAAAPPPAGFWRAGRWLALLAPFSCFALRRRKWQRLWLAGALFFLPVGCGVGVTAGSSSGPVSPGTPTNTTPAGAYALTVTGTVSGTAQPSLSHSVTLTLVVQ